MAAEKAKKTDESQKRKREITLFVLLALLFCTLFWVEIRIFDFSQRLPLTQSIFFFGLINFNLILLLLLCFFILRNLFKTFVDHRKGFIGRSLKSRLSASFLVFSFVPTTLMFVISLLYINSSFDRWLSEKMQGALRSALVIRNEYYSTAKKKNFNAAFVLDQRLKGASDLAKKKEIIEDFRKEQSLDVIEYYPNLDSERVISLVDDTTVPIIPPPPLDLLKMVINERLEKSQVESFNQGNLVRVLVPLSHEKGVVAVASFIPISLISKMDEVSLTYEEMRDVNSFEYPLKSIYLISLVLTTLMILFCSVWFGVYISRRLSFSLETLGQATQKIAEGDYQKVNIDSGETEIVKLAENFNLMVSALDYSRNETLKANENLKVTLSELDQRQRYIQVVLSNVNTGVISLDSDDKITTVNEKASQLLQMDPARYIHKKPQEVLEPKYMRLYRQMIKKMKTHKLNSTQMEVVLEGQDSARVPSMLRISFLHNDRGEDIGKLVTFEDLTDVVQAQRAAAWKEVARRIAHEVKNPLTPIKLSAQRLQKKFSGVIQDPAFTSCTNMIIEQADFLKNLINEFSQFARFPETKPCLSDLNHLVEKLISLYEQAHRHIRFETHLDKNLNPFYFDPEQINRAVFNLLENAVNASVEAKSPKILVETRLDPSSQIVTLRVQDNGRLVHSEEMKRMFEPYYSKWSGGSGLGLTIVKKIIDDHNGYIRVSQNQPIGVIVQIELPFRNS